MSDTRKRLENNLRQAMANKERLISDGGELENFEKVATLWVETYQRGGRLYLAGNGGSAADAQHIAAELVARLGRNRPSIAAESLTVDTSALTAIGNDFSFDEVFSRQLEGKMRKEDLFVALTTSGKSPNILKALETCNSRGFQSVLLSGRGGGPAKALATVAVVAPGESANEVQEVHMVLYHTLCAILEDSIFQK